MNPRQEALLYALEKAKRLMQEAEAERDRCLRAHAQSGEEFRNADALFKERREETQKALTAFLEAL